MTSWRNILLLLVGLVLLEISFADETVGEYGNEEELNEADQDAIENLLAEMYRNDLLNQNEDVYDHPFLTKAHFADYVAKRLADYLDSKRFSEFIGGKHKRFSEFLGGKKRFSEFLGGKKRFSEFLGGKKRFSEFLGGKKRFSEFLGGKKRFSEFLGGKRSSRSLHDKRDFDFLGGR